MEYGGKNAAYMNICFKTRKKNCRCFLRMSLHPPRFLEGQRPCYPGALRARAGKEGFLS